MTWWNLTEVVEWHSLHVNIEFGDSFLFCQKSCQLLSYKSDTCTRFFFQSVLLQPLDANKAASNGCKRTLWKKNSYGIYYFLPSFNSFRIISNFLPPFNSFRIISNFLPPFNSFRIISNYLPSFNSSRIISNFLPPFNSFP